MQVISHRKLHSYNRTGLAVQIPEYVIDAMKFEQGDKVNFYIDGKDLIIRKVVKK